MVDFEDPVAQKLYGPIFTKISALVVKSKGVFPRPIYFVALPFGNGLQYRNYDFKKFNRL